MANDAYHEAQEQYAAHEAAYQAEHHTGSDAASYAAEAQDHLSHSDHPPMSLEHEVHNAQDHADDHHH